MRTRLATDAALVVLLAGGASCSGAVGGGAPDVGGARVDARDGACFRATRLWFEDFETGDYARWTSKTYDTD